MNNFYPSSNREPRAPDQYKIGKPQLMMKLFQPFILCGTLFTHALLADIPVQTRFSQPKVALGNPVQYIVEITVTDTGSKPKLETNRLPFEIDDIDGLRFGNVGTSNHSNIQIINGQAEYSIIQSWIIDIVAPKVGTYTISPFQLQVNGVNKNAPAAKLIVVENTADAQPTINELVFIRTDLPASLYLGQTTQVQLKLYLAADIRPANLSSYNVSADGLCHARQTAGQQA